MLAENGTSCFQCSGQRRDPAGLIGYLEGLKGRGTLFGICPSGNRKSVRGWIKPSGPSDGKFPVLNNDVATFVEDFSGIGLPHDHLGGKT